MPVHERKRARKQGTVNFYKMGLPEKKAREGGRDKMQAESQVFCSAKRPRKPAKVCRPYLSVSLPQFLQLPQRVKQRGRGFGGGRNGEGRPTACLFFGGLEKHGKLTSFFPCGRLRIEAHTGAGGQAPENKPFLFLCKKKIVSGKHNLSFIIFFKNNIYLGNNILAYFIMFVKLLFSVFYNKIFYSKI